MRYDRLETRTSTTSGGGFAGHSHQVSPLGWSRRAFLRHTSAVAVIGAAAGSGLLRADRAEAAPASPGIGLAVPIPYGNDFLGTGTVLHVEAPGFPGFGDDPSTVFNFKGASAVGYIDGKVRRRNRRTGEDVVLPFLASDMRFMQGQFMGRDGHVRDATFGFT